MNSLKKTIQTNSLIQPDSKVIVGLSGGPDSVYLAHQLASLQQELSFTLIAAHLNHEWRETAARDQQFCRMLAQQLNIPYSTATASTLGFTPKETGSQEEKGRQLRRAFFAQVAQEHNAHHIALAHHQDDQLETFFIRLIRGSSLEGLTGIQMQDDMYIRPLLTTPKQAILDYLHTNNIPYCIDETNTSDKFLRNRIRATLIPALNSCDERAGHNALRTVQNLQEAQTTLTTVVQSTMATVCADNLLNIPAFLVLDSYLQRAILLEWLIRNKLPFTPSKGLLDEILRFLSGAKNGQHNLSTAWKLAIHNKKASLVRHYE